MTGRATQGNNLTLEELARLRRDRNNGGGVSGYQDGKGTIREVAGDGDAPFSKSPPFPSNRDLLLESENLDVATYEISAPMDVKDLHIMTLWIDYTAETDDSQLSIISEVREAPGEDFVPIVVVDASITAVTVPVFAADFGSRSLYCSEFRTADPVATGIRFRCALQFAVGPYSQIRFRATELNGDVGGPLVLQASGSD